MITSIYSTNSTNIGGRGMQRYRIFLFPRKRLGVLTHSIWAIFVFFYFPILKKKKNKLFFFSQEKIASFSLLFFFPKKNPKTLFFFFSQEKITRHSLTRISGPEKKNSPGKEKKQHFYSLARFSPKKCKF